MTAPNYPKTCKQSKWYPKITIFRHFSPSKRHFFTTTREIRPQNHDFSSLFTVKTALFYHQQGNAVHSVLPAHSFKSFLCGPHPQHTAMTALNICKRRTFPWELQGGGGGGGRSATLPLYTPRPAPSKSGTAPSKPPVSPRTNQIVTQNQHCSSLFAPKTGILDHSTHSAPPLPFYNSFPYIRGGGGGGGGGHTPSTGRFSLLHPTQNNASKMKLPRDARR